ncbi:hypothetical protein BX600DRAFT_86177 [Xylariales sp. PMI_506]|nr:hypothetical protein BX600DRAFT_86177 [Xylariales sp. PMI_506]
MAQKRTVLITGCSDGGMGSALAIELHKIGWRVFAAARNPSKLAQTTAAGIESVLLDVSSQESIKAAVAKVGELTGGSLDALVNNAGVGHRMPVLDFDLDRVRSLFDVNFFAVIALSQVFFPLLRKSSRGGMIVNNTSIAGYLGLPFEGAYNASKAATSALTRTLRLELQPLGIKVIELVTGTVKTSFFENFPDAALPDGSEYSIAKEEIESFMSGGPTHTSVIEADAWAAMVAKDLNQPNPPYQIWRGTLAGQIRILSSFRPSLFDGQMKKLVGLDVFEKKINEQGNS